MTEIDIFYATSYDTEYEIGLNLKRTLTIFFAKGPK